MGKQQILEVESVRKTQIVNQYLKILDEHIQEIKEGRAEEVKEIRHFADVMHIHPRHLSNTVREVLKRSPCDLFEEKLLAISKELILTTNLSIAKIARHLLYDPSNFNKFFKTYEGITPLQYRARKKLN